MIQEIKGNDNRLISEDEKTSMILDVAVDFLNILTRLGFDVEGDQQLQDTPRRWAKMMVNETLWGNFNPEPKMTVFENSNNLNDMVFLGPIQVKSLCSHHFKDFIGNAYAAYIPDKKICGISKLSRIVNWFMRRPQIQEEMTKQIADYIENKLSPIGCAVYIEAQHLCMTTRGTEEPYSMMTTSAMRGVFKTSELTRNEFLSMIDRVKR